MTAVTDTRTAPAAWAVAAIRGQEAARAEAYERDVLKERHNLNGWACVAPYVPMTEDEIMTAAAERQAHAEAYRASPQGRIAAQLREYRSTGGDERVAHGIECAMQRGSSAQRETISPAECGTILKILDGMNTSTARAIVQAVADNLRAL